MMKKFVMLMLVLGMASLAPASMQISVNGDAEPELSEYTLLPSEHLELDVHITAADATEYGYWLMVVDVAEGTVGQGSVASGAGNLTSVIVNTYYPQYYIDVVFTNAGLTQANYGGGTSGFIGDSGGIALSGAQIDLIDFHCENGELDATIELWTSFNGASGTWALEDSVIIHQVPEPMTMVLLGLGGLFLRRRK